jgi:hypothetical protein
MNIDLNISVLSKVYDDIDMTIDILCPEGIANHFWFRDVEQTDEDMYSDYTESVKNRNAFMQEQKGNEFIPVGPLSFTDFLASEHYEPEAPDYYREFINLFTNCVWDIFSGNNAVMLGKQKIDLGTWKGSAQFLADFVNHYAHSDYHFDSHDFYCGNIDDIYRSEYLPMYELIFKRLKDSSLDWMIDEDITMALDAEFGEEMEKTPEMKINEELLLGALNENMNADQMKRVQEELNREIKPQNNESDLPVVVQAYKNIYGKLPVSLKK